MNNKKRLDTFYKDINKKEFKKAKLLQMEIKDNIEYSLFNDWLSLI